ncbi:DUF2851 family protein [bacterium]|nr:DUF2851 family protein [bacterium]MCI0606472.1 DUF2851 family protein [bacterium]
MEIYLLKEPRANYPERQKVLERLLHCIWSEQLFRKTLNVEGQTLLISSPGWWNLEAGPDFRNAEMFLNGQRLCGDVEIHLNSEDWYHHGHHHDARYNGVVMHVVLYKSQRLCTKQNGESVLQLEMKDSLLEELRLLQQKIPIYQFPFGPEVNVRLCRKFLEEQEEESLLRILDSAGDLRMRRKKEDFLQRIQSGGFLQTFYEGIMEGMGYKQSRYAFRELARRVPLEDLIQYDQSTRRGIDSMAAVLLGTAGLLQDISQTEFDAETNHYMEEIRRYWKRAESRFLEKRLVGFCWYPSSTRPANFPARRLTAIAAFFHYFGRSLLSLLLQPLQPQSDPPKARQILQSWLELFSKPIHIYWSYHFQFDGNKFSAPKRLIGKERSKILVVNVVLPCLLALSEMNGDNRLEALLHQIYRHHPLLCENSITRLMKHRLFGVTDRAKTLIRTAHRQQALHHFFYDFCDNRESSCSRCELAHEVPIQEE